MSSALIDLLMPLPGSSTSPDLQSHDLGDPTREKWNHALKYLDQMIQARSVDIGTFTTLRDLIIEDSKGLASHELIVSVLSDMKQVMHSLECITALRLPDVLRDISCEKPPALAKAIKESEKAVASVQTVGVDPLGCGPGSWYPGGGFPPLRGPGAPLQATTRRVRRKALGELSVEVKDLVGLLQSGAALHDERVKAFCATRPDAKRAVDEVHKYLHPASKRPALTTDPDPALQQEKRIRMEATERVPPITELAPPAAQAIKALPASISSETLIREALDLLRDSPLVLGSTLPLLENFLRAVGQRSGVEGLHSVTHGTKDPRSLGAIAECLGAIDNGFDRRSVEMALDDLPALRELAMHFELQSGASPEPLF